MRVDTGGLIVAGLVLLAAFALVERRAAASLIPLALVTGRRTAPIMLAATTGIFGLIVGVFLLPRYFQTARDVSATHSGLLIFPLLIGLLISVNLAGAVIMRLLDFRTPILAGAGLAIVGAIGFTTFDASTPDWVSLVFMGLIGFGVGPTLSGLQIGIQRTVQPQMIATTMGTLILLRQIGVSIALAAAATLYAGGVAGDPGQAAAATSTGHAVFVVTLFGAVVSAAALLALPRNADKTPGGGKPSHPGSSDPRFPSGASGLRPRPLGRRRLDRILPRLLLHSDPAQLGELLHRRLPPKRPQPESFTPPNGICGSSCTVVSFTWHMPVSSRAATSSAASTSALNTADESPYSVSFATRTASSTPSTTTIDTTGPNDSSP